MSKILEIKESLSNDDCDDNENGKKKAIGLDRQNNNFARASHFFVHCYVVARLQRETSSFHRFFCRCSLLPPFLPGGGGTAIYGLYRYVPL